jgi:hypothetical protein
MYSRKNYTSKYNRYNKGGYARQSAVMPYRRGYNTYTSGYRSRPYYKKNYIRKAPMYKQPLNLAGIQTITLHR